MGMMWVWIRYGYDMDGYDMDTYIYGLFLLFLLFVLFLLFSLSLLILLSLVFLSLLLLFVFFWSCCCSRCCVCCCSVVVLLLLLLVMLLSLVFHLAVILPLFLLSLYSLMASLGDRFCKMMTPCRSDTQKSKAWPEFDRELPEQFAASCRLAFRQLPEHMLPSKQGTGKFNYTKWERYEDNGKGKGRCYEVHLRNRSCFIKKITDGSLISFAGLGAE